MNDLFLRVVQCVERVEKLCLRAFFSRHELNVVHEQHVHAAIPLTKIEDAIVAKRIDHLVHEPLGRDVGELQRRIVLQHVLPDCVHEMRLAETHPAINEQRVVGTGRRLRRRRGTRVCATDSMIRR
jgi:hypothetical protein